MRGVAPLSLFDGLGTARFALESVLRHLHGPPLAALWFAESDTDLRERVDAFWARRAQDQGGAGHEGIAGDVWDLLRDNSAALLARVRTIPPDTLLLLVAGPPLLQLPPAATCGGRVGICGRESVQALAVPLLAQVAAAARPDVQVYVVLEHAGTKVQVYHDALCVAPGVPSGGARAAFPRRRTFFSSLPASACVRPCWWSCVRGVLRGAFTGQASEAALRTATWLVEQGARLGVRPPSVAERARGLGMGENLAEPGLDAVRAYDAQGNTFDPPGGRCPGRAGYPRVAAGGLGGPPGLSWGGDTARYVSHPRRAAPGRSERGRRPLSAGCGCWHEGAAPPVCTTLAVTRTPRRPATAAGPGSRTSSHGFPLRGLGPAAACDGRPHGAQPMRSKRPCGTQAATVGFAPRTPWRAWRLFRTPAGASPGGPLRHPVARGFGGCCSALRCGRALRRRLAEC